MTVFVRNKAKEVNDMQKVETKPIEYVKMTKAGFELLQAQLQRIEDAIQTIENNNLGGTFDTKVQINIKRSK